MESKPIRILQIVAKMDMGGLENFLMNIYRNINKSLIQFDFIVNDDDKNYFEDEIYKMGGKIFKIPSIRKSGHFKYFRSLRKIFKKEQYKIVHSHYNAVSGFILKEAKICKIKNRIAHSHTAPGVEFKYKGIMGLYKKYSKSLINKNVTERFACSKLAGEWLFEGEKFKIINNGIVAKDYKYNSEKRKKIRKELKISEEEIVIGHVGRVDREKNQEFILDIFFKLIEINKNYKLFLIGEGVLRKKLEKKVKDLNVEEQVHFLGVRNDVKDLLQAFDLFIFPSLVEGLPVTLVEAQAAGLKCFISDSITKEVDLGCDLLNFISLEKSAEEWARFIDNNKKYERKNMFKIIQESGYDMEKNIKEIEKMYLSMFN